MHFTGRTWRPPYEAHSVIIQAASGCTYHNKNKEVWQLRKLRAMGINGLSIGVESGDAKRLLLQIKDIRLRIFWNSAGNWMKREWNIILFI